MSAETIKFLPASSSTDILEAIQEHAYEIIQFSGHSDQIGFYLESEKDEVSSRLAADQLGTLLRRGARSLDKLRALVLISCFSSDSGAALVDCAPYLLTMDGPTNDASAIAFAESFYHDYLKRGSVQKAFAKASLRAEMEGKEQGITPVLRRRAMQESQGSYLLEVVSNRYDDSILVDFREAEPDFAKLQWPREKILSTLNRKIRIHEWLFNVPSRGRTFIPVGPFFASMSWLDSSDVVKCHRIMKIKANITEQQAGVWASLLVQFNELNLAPHRLPGSRSTKDLKEGIELYTGFFERHFVYPTTANILRLLDVEQFKASQAAMQGYLTQADLSYKYSEGTGDVSVVRHLEAALSSAHTFVDAICEEITE